MFNSLVHIVFNVGKPALSGFTFTEIRSARASTNKVVCCHFSSDGKLLATGGHDKKVRTKQRYFVSVKKVVTFSVGISSGINIKLMDWQYR